RLSNPDPNLEFVLLTGLPEADQPTLPGDAPLVEQVVAGIAELNRRHAHEGSGPFHLLHRQRRFNPAEGRWMGWERKRGKLDQFNRLLLGEQVDSFETREGDARRLEGIRFVITLDSDTQLPQGTAARLIGTLAHPLNRPWTDASSGRVTAGYTIIQPRVETTPESGNQSLFTRLYCGDTAIDIYSRAVSDVYQDLFGTGIYVGKAIYDLAAFSRSLAGRVPENALASHDLFEGVHGRAALATDIVLYEDYPPSYLAFVRRLHRWVRGDWQLLPWLRRRVPGARHDYLPNRFSWIDRWKIIDNLRRSLLPAALFSLVVSAWTWLPGRPLVWTTFAILAPAGHLFIDFASGLARERWRLSRDLSHRLSEEFGRWVLLLAFLPHQAGVTVDAIVRTLYRITITKRHLLEWTTSAHAAASLARRDPVLTYWTGMAIAPVAALSVAAAVVHWRPSALWVAAPFLLAWLLSPEIARRISAPRPTIRERLQPDDVAFLRGIARRTWLFFETFVGPDGHWLPPDNYQVDPGRIVAHRTSPTNIGMSLLASLSAFDLGYVGPQQLALRIRNTLETIGRLTHYRGHLLNWYHTRTLEPLEPRYVSSVDSGNLAAALLAIQKGCEGILEEPCLRPERWQGLADAIALLRESVGALLPDTTERTRNTGASRLESLVATLHRQVLDSRRDPRAWSGRIDGFESCIREIEAILLETATDHRDTLDLAALHEVRLWLSRIHDHVRSMDREAEALMPWLRLLHTEPPPALPADGKDPLENLRGRIRECLPPDTKLADLPGRGDEALRMLRETRERMIPSGRTPGPDANGTGESREDETLRAWFSDLENAIRSGMENARCLQDDLERLAARAEREALGMDFGLLYDARVRHLFIGYNLTSDELDSHHYDLLASEARLTSFIAIAKGDVPAEHWFALDRPLTQIDGTVALLSWGGTMFEYLMPPLLARSQPGTLLDESQRAAVIAQMEDGRRRGMPWGVSESGFAAFDADQNYQYRAFGVQSLARKRGLDEDRVVAPYATGLALPFFPLEAIRNLQRLRDLGMIGCYGFYEAVDFTPSRLPEGQDRAIVFSHMAHHQGMIFTAIDNLLCNDALVRRFESHPRVQATDLLLQERIPARPSVEEARIRPRPAAESRTRPPVALFPWRPDSDSDLRSLHVLGNGRMSTRVSETGSGALRWRNHSLTRCLPDGTLAEAGLWIYVRDLDSGTAWSAGRQPIPGENPATDVVFHAHMLELHRRQHGISIRTDIAVGAADDIEVRRITLVNETDRPRSLSLTSFAEVVLGPEREDRRHPAFSKLFVEGRYVPTLDALVFTRRPREPDDHFPVLLHRIVADSPAFQNTGFEIDRERFLGRNGSFRRPLGLEQGLSGTQGATLDPCLALQAKVELAPFAIEQFAFVTIAGPTRQAVEETAARFQTLASFEWLLADAHAEAGHEAARLGLEAGRYPEFQKLLSIVLAADAEPRASAAERAANREGQQALWALGISGDDPLLVFETSSAGPGSLLADLVRAHRLWRRRGTGIDLVIVSEVTTSYRDDAFEDIHRLLEELGAAEWLGRPAGIHLIRPDQITPEQKRLLEASAAAILTDDRGPLHEQLARRETRPLPLPPLEATRMPGGQDPAPPIDRPEDLLFDNGFGGFTPDGREYVIHLDPGETTPAPWCNVLANEDFGCLVTEAGGGYSWAGNSGEFRLTPWTNDPVLDPASEALYLRDEETTEVWSPTPGPAGRDRTTQIRHGTGYSEWRQNGRGLSCDVRISVPPDDPVKIIELHLVNHADRPRRITATCYARWLLGRAPEPGPSHVTTWFDPPSRTLYARNGWNADFAERVAFLTSDREPHGFTADRTEFLGRDGDPAAPAALRRIGLAGRVGAGLDPCAAYQVHLDIGPGEEIRTHFILGAASSADEAAGMARRWQEPLRVADARERIERHWDALLSVITVETPEPAMDLLINRWALYQVLSARILARTGFYQSSGAYGFRDQLQDILALLHGDPARARAHLLESASRQFEEGDVLHWWHPPLGRGVRTRCSDDLLWLPYVMVRYVEVTGDKAVLDVEVPFLSAPPLADDEHERYDLFRHGGERASLFEHGRRALERGLTRGAHGLPLIGGSDWNDGMNRVGLEGRGESVWLAWFAGSTATDFADLCEDRGDLETAKRLRERALALFAAANDEGWDGAWYRRAFDDDGIAWGSAASDECRIDSIAQSWAILSKGAPADRGKQAIRSALSQLVQDESELACLLWPPFDLTARDPGYIKAYPPGIRENGGQYSHAAAWLGWALAEIGEGDEAARILRMINPIERTRSAEAARLYRTEPYAISGDIASVEPHVGRGGWSWYTGAASWSWRLAVEQILGIRWIGERIEIRPRIPDSWPGYRAKLHTRDGTIEIVVEKKPESPAGRFELIVDGKPTTGSVVACPTGGGTRHVLLRSSDPHDRPAGTHS
ncbi:MAG TPA: cellobiose phosphorylase, partial [Deltaproteobacteria bacterium]|nr:cellobiose phosphorylase [Deltaproteobacteria bacterium]